MANYLISKSSLLNVKKTLKRFIPYFKPFSMEYITRAPAFATRPEVIIFFMLSSTEHEISTAH